MNAGAAATVTASGETTTASPCINVCELDERTGWCRGCWRTIDEIAAWGALDERERRDVCARLPQRKRAFGANEATR